MKSLVVVIGNDIIMSLSFSNIEGLVRGFDENVILNFTLDFISMAWSFP